MAKTKTKFTFPWGNVQIPEVKDDRTSVIYYGGKSRDAWWIVDKFVPHVTFVDVFGGGAAITLAKQPSQVDIYNDIGNVSNFFRVLRDNSDALVEKLLLTPYDRGEFEYCSRTWQKSMEEGDEVEWARKWFVVINQGYTHEELCTTWHVSKVIDSTQAWNNHIYNIPYIADKFKRIIIERKSFENLIPLYDKRDTLFYCDPPYVADTRASQGNYMNEMDISKHEEFLRIITKCEAQVIVSGYDSELYNDYLSNWRICRKTAKSAIQNSSSMADRAERTEVLWIKEHYNGLWAQEAYEEPQATMARVQR